MPSLKELRSQLKKSMKPISKMSRDEVILMLEKHKGSEVEMPKAKLVKEHEELVKVLEKPTKKAVKSELKKQSSELKELTKPVKKESVKLPESSEDEMPKEKVKKVMKKVEPKEKVMKKKVTDQEDKSSSSETKDLTARQRWGQLRKEGLSSAEAWAKVRE